jgi:hypothetical protein
MTRTNAESGRVTAKVCPRLSPWALFLVTK